MQKHFAVIGIIVCAVLLMGVPASATAIKNWTSRETIRASDLNAALNHIHTAAEAGVDSTRIEDGAVASVDIADDTIVNADVSSSAAIAHSKLATPALVPKAWVYVETTCSTSPCTITASSGVGSVTRLGTGQYSVGFSPVLTNGYATLVTPIRASGSGGALCTTIGAASGGVTIDCYDAAGVTLDVGLNVLVLDN